MHPCFSPMLQEVQLLCFLGQSTPSKWRPTPIRKFAAKGANASRGANSFLQELAPIKKGGRNRNDNVAFPASVPFYGTLNTIADLHFNP